ncbi:hypothetical protein RRG08_062191 [Elysia crispata]|uniref:Uncharacterized protein n=1 Tax=Elysia crispata TaxID=231223 RepID=A0AAE1D4S7_9GAST|nr:hypothetical protein RRG08_062191 [Elysia crispata]
MQFCDNVFYNLLQDAGSDNRLKCITAQVTANCINNIDGLPSPTIKQNYLRMLGSRLRSMNIICNIEGVTDR